ncbi:MAG: WYL domain-containing protein [Planctomycetota bacterium]
MRSKRLERLLRLIQSLQTGRQGTIDEISKSVGVSRRTIFRDLEILSRAGINFTFDRDTKQYATGESTVLPPVSLTQAEAFAVLLGMRILLAWQIVPEANVAASAAAKIESLVPASLREHCNRLLDRIRILPPQSSDCSAIADILPLVQQVLTMQVKVKVRYDSYCERRVLNLVLHPYFLICTIRGWYLIAFCETRKNIRTFKVERLLQIQALTIGFRIQPTFDITNYFGYAWYMIRGDRCFHIKILFSKKVAAAVDEISWHKTKQTTFLDDGSLIFEADVEGLQEIICWVLSYGGNATVIEPPELREAVLQHVRALEEQYPRNK